MIEIVSDNIISPLGFSTEENFQNVLNFKSGLKISDGIFSLDGNFCLSAIDWNLLDLEFENFFSKSPSQYLKLEKALLLTVGKAIKNIDVTDFRTGFFFSSTKGNIELLDKNQFSDSRLNLWYTAKMISSFFNNPNIPIVISNACVSGLCAIISACRAISSGMIDKAVVFGGDILTKFTLSGFSSLKALSNKPCRPFDIERNGLNLGEAVSAMVLKKTDSENYIAGSIRQDAYHISSPSKTAEGAFNALQEVLKNIDKNNIAFISAHGTATIFNDEMEATAISKAELSEVPICALKGYFGHTLGAAGLLETILSYYALNKGVILKTLGFEDLGVSKKIKVTTKNDTTDKQYFVKLISGFGGVNAAAVFKKKN